MAGRLSFSIALNLLTENFKKGASSVQNGLKSMQLQVLTFAAALGFSSIGLTNFISKLIEVARETARVTTALKNVSGSMAQFAANQRFVLDMAKKYGVEVLALTGNYAKFTAAASNAGVAMSDQKKIFESVSRASVAFGLTADDTNLTFLAITQMMSKGKISSEELRRQLGERLPIAMAAMAKAAGVPINKLDKLLQQGKLMSNDILPKFADALNEMIPNVNTDNVETSINRLKNAFTELVRGTTIQQNYKSLIDAITKIVEYGANNVKLIVGNLVAVLTAVILGKFFKWVVAEIAAAQRAAMIAASKASKAAGVAFDAAAWRAQSAGATMQTVFARATTAIRTAFMSMLPTAIIMGIGLLVSKIISARDEAKRLRSIFSEYQKEASAIGKPEDADRLQRLFKIVSDTNNSFNIRKNALSEINKLLGTSYSMNQDILGINSELNKKISERVKLLKDAAAVEFYQNQKLDAESKANAIISKYGDVNSLNRAAKASANAKKTIPGAIGSLFNFGGVNNALNDAIQVDQYNKIWQNANKQLELFEKNLLTSSTSTSGEEDDGSKKKTDLQKAEEEYTDTLKELNNQKKNEAITGKEYQEALDKLNESSFKKLSGLLSPEQAAKNKIFQQAKSGYNSSVSGKIEKSYWDGLNELSNQYAANVITEKEYKEAKLSLIEKTLKEIGALDDLTEANYSFIKDLKSAGNELKKVSAPVLEKRDTTFDYKKTKADIAAEDLEVAKNNLEKLKDAYKDVAKEMEKELNDATGNVKSLEDALKIAKVRQDIKDLGKEIDQTFYGGVKDIASSADRVVSAFSSLRNVFSDVDASGWERIMAVWNALTSTIDSFMSILELVKNMTDLVNKLAAAKQAEAVIDTTVTGLKVTNAATEAAATSAVAVAQVAESRTVTGAYSAEMAAKTAAAYASIPFIGPAIASAQIATMQALIAAAAIPKFAGGGIIQGGPSSGDKILARVNAGEMILNKNQQATLFSMLDGGINVNNSGGEVRFVIEGEKLVGVLTRFNRRQKRIKG